MNENLHSLNQLKSNIKAMRVISFLFPKNKRDELKKIEEQIEHMEKVMDSFNNCFSELGWCAYDSMNMFVMEMAITQYEALGAEEGEKILLDYYMTDIREVLHTLKNQVKPYQQRYQLIQKAFEDHFAGRYYASVPLFLIIIDGSVNDYTKSKGFFAEGTDVTAWDCLVGCSDGLTKMQAIFNKGRNKTNQDEIRVPYRNGILHGRDLNYGNKYVSCKCVALMFALADWMRMKDSEENRKQKFEKENDPPPISESLKKMKENALERKEIDSWTGRNITIGVDIPVTPTIEDCNEYQYAIPLIKAFEAWNAKNYGKLAIYFKNMFRYESSEKKRAGECRQMFGSKNLRSFEIKEIEERACALTRILVQADWEIDGNHFSEPLEFGVIYQDENEKTCLPWRGNGAWCLMPWNIQGLYKI